MALRFENGFPQQLLTESKSLILSLTRSYYNLQCLIFTVSVYIACVNRLAVAKSGVVMMC